MWESSAAGSAAQWSRCSLRAYRAGAFRPYVRTGRTGRGAAYGTRCHGVHRLNTRVAAMSAFADEPDHFVRWLGGARGAAGTSLRADCMATTSPNWRRAHSNGRVSHASVSGSYRSPDAMAEYELRTASGANFAARAVVLATGNAPPDDDVLPAAVVGHAGYVADPWRFDYRKAVGDVLVIGSGLTALDVLLALEAAGHRGSVFVVSRRGRFPETHTEGVSPLDVTPVLETADARARLRSFRCRSATRERAGFDWRSVVDAIRPECETLWKRLGAQASGGGSTGTFAALGTVPSSGAVARRRGRGGGTLAAGRLRPSTPGKSPARPAAS